MNQQSSLIDTIQTWFGSREGDGLFAQSIPSYEYRKQQVEMATAVAEAIENREVLIVEAGTGVGKTLAYLAPIFASGKKAVISTATKTLQHQLVKKDIPLLLKFLSSLPADENAVCFLKGRSNYLCKRKLGRFEQTIMQGRLDQLAELISGYEGFRFFRKILSNWVKNTSTGELSELAAELVNNHEGSLVRTQLLEEKLAVRLGSSSDFCPGSSCAFFSSCFVNTVRKKAQKAKIVVVNHHLLCTDLAGKMFQSFEILPSADVLVIDEAHHFPDVVSHTFTVSYSSRHLDRLMEEVAFITAKKGNIWKKCSKIEKNIRDHHEALASLLSGWEPRPAAGYYEKEHRSSLRNALKTENDLAEFKKIISAIAEAYSAMALLFDKENDDHVPALTMIENCRTALMKFLDDKSAEEFPWFELIDKDFSICLTPLDAPSMVTGLLLTLYSSIVFTSATIAVANSREHPDFSYFKEQAGLNSSVKTMAIGSPYSYKDQMICFIPPIGFPTPDDPGFADAVIQQAIPIIKAFRGGTLFLCTSYRNMKLIADGIRQAVSDRRVLVQGEIPRNLALEEFRRDTGSVLVATGSFWEGIDVPGESLQVLLIDKLPFPSPADPLVEGRCARIDDMGRVSFMEYSLPRTILALRQGIGRLIRSSTDRGVVGIFDVRVRKKGYGRKILVNLPPCRIVERIEDLLPQACNSEKTQC